ncbi:unnamed protein product [Clonostachys rosea f. rosea IK726]|uniref:Uncharacterized protein n=1 Tax=Clonostachys rosea f. rosea IK726 TaxID=1349383 RepID=A0ACA9TUT2_BIOOC|nr:unnamed protein product [Clonostachys rosea f. rosea IK726]
MAPILGSSAHGRVTTPPELEVTRCQQFISGNILNFSADFFSFGSDGLERCDDGCCSSGTGTASDEGVANVGARTDFIEVLHNETVRWLNSIVPEYADYLW